MRSLNNFEAFVAKRLGSHEADQFFILGKEDSDPPRHLHELQTGLGPQLIPNALVARCMHVVTNNQLL